MAENKTESFRLKFKLMGNGETKIKKNEFVSPKSKSVLKPVNSNVSKDSDCEVKSPKLEKSPASEVMPPHASPKAVPDNQQALHAVFQETDAAVKKMKAVLGNYRAKTFFKPNIPFLKGVNSGISQIESGLLKISEAFSGKVESSEVVALEPPTPPVSEAGSSVHADNHNDSTAVTTDTSIHIEDDIVSISSNDDKPPVTTVTTTKSSTKRKRESGSKQVGRPPNKRARRRSLLSSFMTTKKEDVKTEDSNEDSQEEDKDETEEKEFEVEKIIDYNKVKGVGQYLVRWRGYKADDDTWEPYENLTGCEDILDIFIRGMLQERIDATTQEDFKDLQLPGESDLSKVLRDAFWAQLTAPCQEDVVAALPLLVGKKVRVKPMPELEEDVDRLLATKDLVRHKKLFDEIQSQLVLRECKQQRDIQEAELRRWQREMSRVCVDPAPLTVINEVDLQLPPKDFVYINEYVASKGIEIPKEPMVGCSCEDCGNSQGRCCPKAMSSHFAYTKHGRLKVSIGTAIYECNKMCACAESGNCINRVVQRGRKIQLTIFRTANNRGWGVKAGELIRAGSFVTEYVGEVISSEEAERRGQIYDTRGCTYLFDLDYNKGDLNPYTVDAAKYGNVSHFINHSCDPNLVVFNVWVNCLDPDLPKLALFAVREIKKGEEITFDYNASCSRNTAGNISSEDLGESALLSSPSHGSQQLGTLDMAVRKTPKRVSAGTTECHCGAANCRKVFF